jgi:hypothetical protein
MTLQMEFVPAFIAKAFMLEAMAMEVIATHAFPTLPAAKEIRTLVGEGVPDTAGFAAKRLEPGICTSNAAERVPSPNPL